jgi:PPOX class probable F420-dependent enzyme
MPGYGIRPAGEGTGLLPWSWAEERLEKSHDYWIATVWPDGRPHVMPVWGMWRDGELWFSSSLGSRKTRNLLANPVCAVTSDDPQNPVIFEGTATLEQDIEVLEKILAAENEKYGTDYGMDMFDPAVNATFRIRPRWAFALTEGDFTGSPTKWEF